MFTSIDSPCEFEYNNPDSLDARLFFTVVLAVAPAVAMDEASSLPTSFQSNTRFFHRLIVFLLCDYVCGLFLVHR